MTTFNKSFIASPIILASLAAGVFTACGEDFGNCEAQRTCASGGAGGDASGGANNGAATNSLGGRTSSGGGTTTTGGSAQAGANNGGAGGDDDGAGGTNGGSGGNGEAGDDGAGATTGGTTTSGGTGSSMGGSTTGGTDTGSGEAGSGGEAGGTTGPRCGDGTVDTGEACDDGNDDPADGCRTNCTWGPARVVVGGLSSCAIFGDGTAKCWGDNRFGVLGQGDQENRGDDPGEMGAALPFIKVDGKVGQFTDLAVHQHMACGVVNEQVWCWGEDVYGQLGQGHVGALDTVVATPVRVPLVGKVANVAVGGYFACVLMTNGDVRCWGRGLYGVLGIGNENDIGDDPGEMASVKSVQLDARAKQLAIGSSHACALLEGGQIKCWGRGIAALGQGVTGDAYCFGDDPSELSPPAVPLGTAVASFVSVSSSSACAVLNGLVKCWGDNGFGQLGIGSTSTYGDEPNELGTSLPVVPLRSATVDQVKTTHSGSSNSCALLTTGGVKCWGNGSNGIVSQSTLTTALGNIGDSPDEVSLLATIDFGAGISVRSASSAERHICALLSTGDVKCWGVGPNGQLATGAIVQSFRTVSPTSPAVPLD